jgi:hypothetical protein
MRPRKPRRRLAVPGRPRRAPKPARPRRRNPPPARPGPSTSSSSHLALPSLPSSPARHNAQLRARSAWHPEKTEQLPQGRCGGHHQLRPQAPRRAALPALPSHNQPPLIHGLLWGALSGGLRRRVFGDTVAVPPAPVRGWAEPPMGGNGFVEVVFNLAVVVDRVRPGG